MSVDQKTSCTIYVRNTSRFPQDVQVLAPPATSGFSLAPQFTSNLNPGEQFPVQLSFDPRAATINPARIELLHPNAARSSDEAILQGGSFLYKGAVHLVPASATSGPSDSANSFWSAISLIASRTSGRSRPFSAPAAALMMQSAVLPRVLSLSSTNIDFLTTSVASKTTSYVSITNHSDVPIGLLSQGMDGSGAFQLVSVPPSIAAQSTLRIAVQFCPADHKTYISQFTFRASEGGAPCTLHLRGTGHSPKLSCVPHDGRVDFGNVLVGTSHRRFFDVINDSIFSVAFSISQQVQGSRDGFGAGMRFTIEPEQGELSSKSTQRFAVSFFSEEPTAQAVNSMFSLSVRDQPASRINFHASACAWSSPVFAFIGENSSPSCVSAGLLPYQAQPLACSTHLRNASNCLSVGRVLRSSEVPPPYKEQATAEVSVVLPVECRSVHLDESAFGLQPGEVRKVEFINSSATNPGLVARDDGSVTLAQSVEIRASVRFNLKGFVGLPQGVLDTNEMQVPLAISAVMEL
jgi:hypothetical protein